MMKSEDDIMTILKQLYRQINKHLIASLLLLALGAGTVFADDINITSLSEITDADGSYVITSDISGGTPGVTTFNGTLEAAIDPNTHMPYKITGLTTPLFTTLTGTVKNLVLDGVNISGNTGNTGAIACTANSAARIYNVGILSGSVGGTGYTGGLVGLLDGTARVVNCYSYADITGGTNKGGIVGYNNVASTQKNVATMGVPSLLFLAGRTLTTETLADWLLITTISTGPIWLSQIISTTVH